MLPRQVRLPAVLLPESGRMPPCKEPRYAISQSGMSQIIMRLLDAGLHWRRPASHCTLDP